MFVCILLTTFNKLNSLIIDNCIALDSEELHISSVTRANLAIITTCVVPRNYRKIELSTASLCSISFNGIPYQKLYGSHLCSVKHLNIDANDRFLIKALKYKRHEMPEPIQQSQKVYNLQKEKLDLSL